jgi:hypothetical protein
MKNSTKTVLAAAVAAAAIAFPLQSCADGGHHGRWKHEWKHHHRGFDHGHRHRGRDVVVIDEPRYVYREPTYVYREPVYVYEPRRPAIVIGVDIPSVVVPF